MAHDGFYHQIHRWQAIAQLVGPVPVALLRLHHLHDIGCTSCDFAGTKSFVAFMSHFHQCRPFATLRPFCALSAAVLRPLNLTYFFVFVIHPKNVLLCCTRACFFCIMPPHHSFTCLLVYFQLLCCCFHVVLFCCRSLRYDCIYALVSTYIHFHCYHLRVFVCVRANLSCHAALFAVAEVCLSFFVLWSFTHGLHWAAALESGEALCHPLRSSTTCSCTPSGQVQHGSQLAGGEHCFRSSVIFASWTNFKARLSSLVCMDMVSVWSTCSEALSTQLVKTDHEVLLHWDGKSTTDLLDDDDLLQPCPPC